MAKSIMVNGYEFVTNNFAAILDNQSAPDQFHRVQDFLRASSIGYALIQPESISTKAVIQIWSTAKVEDGEVRFTHAGQEFVITPDVVREALHLPQVNSLHLYILMMKLKVLLNH